MMLRVSVQEPPDHALILRVVPARFGLEEIHAAFAQGDGDLDPLVPEDKILGAGKKVRNDPWVSEGFVRVPDLLAHIFARLSLGEVGRLYQPCAASACNLSPRAFTTLRIVSKSGLRSPESAL